MRSLTVRIEKHRYPDLFDDVQDTLRSAVLDEHRGYIALDGMVVYTSMGFSLEECKQATREKLASLIIDCAHAIKEVDNV